ncbi:MAG: NADH-quinone oxidoreductase subunit NuoE [Bdellovibrionales bacterium]|nr:NADH-quinone oxidoreductase subunit NuoE [Bdellovibrionales bacterium]
MTEHKSSNGTVPTLSAAAEDRLKQLVSRYPRSKSAIMPALYIAQEELGWINDAAVHWVADRLSLPLAHVIQVATFYTMYYKQPVGKYHIQVCRTLSCMICGAKDLTAHIKQRLKIGAHEVTNDGVWSFEEVECLGSCGTAPMVQINDVFFENLTPESLDALMDRIEKEQPDLRYSTVRQDLGAGLSGEPKSRLYTAPVES